MQEFLLNNQKIAEEITNFLKEEFKKRNKKAAILGISGGIDSTTTAFLCKSAGLDLYGVLLPYKNKGIEHSMAAVRALNLPQERVIIVDIGLSVDGQAEELEKTIKLDRPDIGNIMARQRMVAQYALAKKLNGLVVGTENLSEYYFGYFTLHGDQACDIPAISGLWKTQVKDLAKFLGVPSDLIERTPTAGLWDGQTDEGEFGFTYNDADQIMHLFINKKMPQEEIIKKGFNKETVGKVLDRINATEYKRQGSPRLLFNNMHGKTISIIGLGKVGSSMAAAYASKGYKVIGVDINPDFVRLINEAQPPVAETNLADYLSVNKERISATQDFKQAILNSKLTFVIVPTPSMEDGDFSTKYVADVGKKIGEALKEKNEFHVIALTSTVTPRSCRRDIIPAIEESSGKKCGLDFGFCYNPQFIALGRVISDLLKPYFVLVGESDSKSGDIVADFYRSVCENNPEIKRMDIINAEVVKIAANTFVTTKISYSNMISELCEKLPGGNVDAVMDAIAHYNVTHGPRFLKGGFGYGGPCLPRDNKALIRIAQKVGVLLPLAEVTDKINDWQVPRLANLIISKLPMGGKVAILGLAYKQDTDFIERSQAIDLAQLLFEKKVFAIAYDPRAIENAKIALGDKIKFASSMKECVADADLIVIATPWQEFKQLQANDLKKGDAKVFIIDCWRLLNPDSYKEVAEHVSLGVNNELN